MHAFVPTPKLHLLQCSSLLVASSKANASWIEKDAEGKRSVVMDGQKYELGMNVGTILSVSDDNGKPQYLINLNHFEQLTMEDIKSK